MINSPRERVLAAINHQPVDRVPTDYWGTPETTQMLLDHLGCESQLAMYDRLGVDGIIGVAPPYIGPILADFEEGPSQALQSWGMRYDVTRRARRSKGRSSGPPYAAFSTIMILSLPSAFIA